MNLNFDLSQLNNIDLQDVSKWPVALKGIVIILLMGALLGAGYWFDTKNQLVTLEKARKQEKTLKETFAAKQNKAANLDDYREQMKEMKASFGTMLRQLPSETEVEDVLVDISQAGLANGLEFELFQPGKEVPAEFYAELPIKIEVVGDYHDFGRFVSDVAALPRIVTLHDFTITPQKGRGSHISGKLVMQATAKTYRYLNEE
jgi:type IV pilus assembly protein PilO